MMKVNSFRPVRKQMTAEDVDKQVREAAKQMEGKFLEEMVKQMRSTVHDTEGFIPTSNAEKIFREQLDQQYVAQWGDKGGLGLSDMIYNQIMEKYGAQMGLRHQEERPQGPIQLKPQKEMLPVKKGAQNSSGISPAAPPPQSGVSPASLPPQSGKTSYLFDLQKMSLESPEVQAPWSGHVTGVHQISGDEYLLQLKHSNGLNSQMVFRGMPEADIRQASAQNPLEVSAGQRLGALSPEAKSFTWTVDVSASV